jgi:hypothetical protein
MWRCNTPFPQIDKLLSGSFPTLVTCPVSVPQLPPTNVSNPPTNVSNPPTNVSNPQTDVSNPQTDVSTDESDSSIDTSNGDSPPTNRTPQKRKKTVIKKRVNLGPCFFSHGCVCGHNIAIRDLFVNSRQRRNPNSVTIQTKTQPVKLGLRLH